VTWSLLLLDRWHPLAGSLNMVRQSHSMVLNHHLHSPPKILFITPVVGTASLEKRHPPTSGRPHDSRGRAGDHADV